MRICVTCVYWTLLFISVASSALLFIIVASENAQTNYYSSFKSNQTIEISDNELEDLEHDDLGLPNIAIAKLQNPMKLETNYKDHNYQDKFAKESTNFETVMNDEEINEENPYKNPDVVAESLTQQPNLSQGISDTGQTTVLPLTDAAVTELKNLVEPRLGPEFSRARLILKNSSSLTNNVHIEQETINKQEIVPSTQVTSLPDIDENTEELNETSVLEDESLLLQDTIKEEVVELEEVVVVRAEQGPIIIDESEFSFEEEVIKVLPDELTKVDEIFATPELSDTEAKAQLVDHTKDEAAAVLRNGIMPVGSTNPHEEIPSFNEWTQKRLEEAEKKKMHPNASVQNSGAPTRGVGGMKVRSKNYASPDCGAKIVAANPETRSARNILVSTRDEYMLNTCTSRIWFVVELCEAIQAKKIELANFELFSSSPKDFSVYISDRFPTRDWSLVGQFTAKDVKDTQSFVLQPQLFGKFIKVELHTYYGSEHFCPVSLFRAYGTSEFEVLETETENQISRDTNVNVDDDEDSEEVLDVEHGEPPRNLFGSARDAVLSIVKKAAEVLVKSSELSSNNITKIEQVTDSDHILESFYISCTTPKYTLLCDNCSDQKFERIFQLISCRDQQLNDLLKSDIVNKTLRQNGFCADYGVRIEDLAKKNAKQKLEKTKDVVETDRQIAQEVISTKNFQLTFLAFVFTPEYITALCNMLAIKERQMIVNTSYEILFDNTDGIGKEGIASDSDANYSNDAVNSVQHIAASHASISNVDSSKSASYQESQGSAHTAPTEEINKSVDISVELSPNSESSASQIKPFEKAEARNDSSTPVLESSKDSIEEMAQSETLTTVPVSLNTVQHPASKASEEPTITSGDTIENSRQTTVPIPIVTIDNNESLYNDVISDVDPLEFPDIQTKTEKIERLDQEGKQRQTDILDQEIKLSSQDSLTFDSLLSDLKDLEGEAINVQNGPAASASITQSTTNTMPQKESVFLRLSNRIKALERNMSLSGQYLEELSRRYKKQVEEMQKSLERTVSAMNDETRKWEERESKKAEEIAMLKEEIAALSKSLKSLLYDRDSWHGKFLMISQHILFIFSEVFVIFLVLLYCRRSKRFQEREKQQLKKDAVRRKSAENFSSHMKKAKKRRPSEIASHITGTYRDLMIDDKPYESKQERKKKRKKENSLSANKTNPNRVVKRSSILHCRSVPNASIDDEHIPTRKTSSVEMLQKSDSQTNVCKGSKSSPENTIDWFNNHAYEAECNVQLTLSCNDDLDAESTKGSDFSSTCTENISEPNLLSLNTYPQDVVSSEKADAELLTCISNSKDNNTTLKNTKSRTSSFMKTVLSTRKKRRKVQTHDTNDKWNDSTEQKLNLNDNVDKCVRTSSTASKLFPETLYTDSSTTINDLLMDQRDQSRSINITSVSERKDRKNTGFRKMSHQWSSSPHNYVRDHSEEK